MQLFRRKKILISRLQYRLAANSLIYILIVIITFFLVVFTPLIQKLNSSLPSRGNELEYANIFLYLHSRSWPILLSVVLLILLHVVIVSHRIAGPMYRMRSIISSIGRGDLAITATIRKHDLLQEEAVALNEMKDSLRARVEEMAGYSREMTDIVSALQSDAQNHSSRKIDAEVEKLSTAAAGLKKCLDTFNLKSS